MGLWASFSQDVTHGIKEKTLARSLPARPRERGRTWLGMIAHRHHPLMVRMKSTWGMQLVLVWGHYPRARASQLTGKMTTTQVGHIWVTLTLIKAHKESMLQVGLAEFLHNIQAPADTGHSKEERLFFLGALSKEATYQAMVQWLKDNLVPIFPLLYCHCE